MTAIPKEAVSVAGDDVTVDAEVLAPRLGLSVTALQQAMNEGKVRTLVERGEDEDAGRMRLTFRYGGIQFSVMREPGGQLHETEPPPPERRPVRPSLMQLMDSDSGDH
ncbi:hypothetical protein DES49_1564 [Halospina denitrificans]|uniref:Uncharacterized protein n=1 Tax=Halospina denitrificans TaxID=332522 RepID=A0A4R7JT39_9GAMM|nr:DUF6522 family protein [Halospina denitrificans]TDT41471.1 hypothetical protein DES49_1564 [Halospina denitrificans]